MGMGKKIRALREARKWSQSHLCALAGVEQATLSAIERRDSTRSVYLVPIAKALGVTLEQLRDLTVPEMIALSEQPYGQGQSTLKTGSVAEPLVLYSASGDSQSTLLRLFDELHPTQQAALLRELETTVQANRAIAAHYQGKRVSPKEDSRVEATFGLPTKKGATP